MKNATTAVGSSNDLFVSESAKPATAEPTPEELAVLAKYGVPTNVKVETPAVSAPVATAPVSAESKSIRAIPVRSAEFVEAMGVLAPLEDDALKSEAVIYANAISAIREKVGDEYVVKGFSKGFDGSDYSDFILSCLDIQGLMVKDTIRHDENHKPRIDLALVADASGSNITQYACKKTGQPRTLGIGLSPRTKELKESGVTATQSYGWFKDADLTAELGYTDRDRKGIANLRTILRYAGDILHVRGWKVRESDYANSMASSSAMKASSGLSAVTRARISARKNG